MNHLAIGVDGTQKREHCMSTEDNKALVRRSIEEVYTKKKYTKKKYTKDNLAAIGGIHRPQSH